MATNFTGSLAARNFRSTDNATIATTGTSANVTMVGDGTDFQFANVGTAEAFVTVATSAATAIAGGGSTKDGDGSNSVPAGAIMVYSFPNAGSAPSVAAITATGTTTLRVARGFGS